MADSSLLVVSAATIYASSCVHFSSPVTTLHVLLFKLAAATDGGVVFQEHLLLRHALAASIEGGIGRV